MKTIKTFQSCRACRYSRERSCIVHRITFEMLRLSSLFLDLRRPPRPEVPMDRRRANGFMYSDGGTRATWNRNFNRATALGLSIVVVYGTALFYVFPNTLLWMHGDSAKMIGSSYATPHKENFGMQGQTRSRRIDE